MLRTVVSLSLLVWAGVQSAAAQVVSGGQPGLASVPEIATSGRGDVHVAPDMAVFNLVVETRAPNAAAAAVGNAAKVKAAVDAIRGAGVDSAQINTVGYSVGPTFENSKKVGLTVRTSLRVEVRRIADIGKVIDAAVATDGVQIYQLQFQRASTLEARQSALALSVTEARRDAETLAQAAGGTLGRLLSLTTGVSQYPIWRTESFLASSVVVTSASSQQAPIIPGELTVTVVTSGRWQFVPRK